MLLLSACGPEHNPLFVQGTEDGALPVIGWRECPGAGGKEGIVELALYRWDEKDGTADDPGELLWHIRSVGKEMPARVRLGSEPKGFTTRQPMTGPLDPGTTYALAANEASDEIRFGFVTFRPEQLTGDDRIVFKGEKAESRDRYQSRDDKDFGCHKG